MCLVTVAWRVSAERPLIVLANRDEFFERLATPLQPWVETPDIIAGRDLLAGGTWLGYHRGNGRMAVVTNVREPLVEVPVDARTRGDLVLDFLRSEIPADAAATELSGDKGREYAGFNLLLCDRESLWYCSNRAPARRLDAGVYGLSNAALDTPWPKVLQVREGLRAGLAAGQSLEELATIMRDRRQPPDSELPHTGVPIDWERRLGPVFIDGDSRYGTRAVSALEQSRSGRVRLQEWSRSSLEDAGAMVHWEG